MPASSNQCGPGPAREVPKVLSCSPGSPSRLHHPGRAPVGVMTIHVLTYARRLPRMLAARTGRSAGLRSEMFSGSGRWLALAVSLVVGIAVAALASHLSSKWGVGLYRGG